MNQEKLNTMTDQQKLELIFIGGLSTSNEVTRVSGRGVGMSAVADAVKRVAGTISVSSKDKQGTTIRISVPVRKLTAQMNDFSAVG